MKESGKPANLRAHAYPIRLELHENRHTPNRMIEQYLLIFQTPLRLIREWLLICLLKNISLSKIKFIIRCLVTNPRQIILWRLNFYPALQNLGCIKWLDGKSRKKHHNSMKIHFVFQVRNLCTCKKASILLILVFDK